MASYYMIGDKLDVRPVGIKELFSMKPAELVNKFTKGEYQYIDAIHDYFVTCIKNDIDSFLAKDKPVIAGNSAIDSAFAYMYMTDVEKDKNRDYLQYTNYEGKEVFPGGKLVPEYDSNSLLNFISTAKTQYIMAEDAIECAALSEKYKGYDKAFSGFLGRNGELNEMINLLDSGDSTFRGSSKAYKDIQNDLSDLKIFINNLPRTKDGTAEPVWYEKRYISVCLDAICEKAKNYLLDHESRNVDINNPVGSYEYKRVALMRKIYHMTAARVQQINNKISFFGENKANDIVGMKKYRRLLKTKLADSRYSDALFNECVSVDMEVKEGKGSRSELGMLINRSATDRHFIIVRNQFAGKTASFDTIMKKVFPDGKKPSINDKAYIADINNENFIPGQVNGANGPAL